MKNIGVPLSYSSAGIGLKHRRVAIPCTRLGFVVRGCQPSDHGDGENRPMPIYSLPLVSKGDAVSVHSTINSSTQLANKEFMKTFIFQEQVPSIITNLVEKIKRILTSLGDGQISISAYDTAWVARVPALNGSDIPEFPKSLQWIVDNQLPDGSWGDEHLFMSYDRLCSTIACIIALKKWKANEMCIKKGLTFIWRTIKELENEEVDHMPAGFEVVFLTMLDDSKDLGLELPYSAPFLRHLKIKRDEKLARIPLQLLHERPTTLLHSLEGLHKLINWHHIMKLQSKNGSFLDSPASTACALMYTHDKGCLNYLKNILNIFEDAVPNVYPIDFFERLWIIDRLERLGIAHYFEAEITHALDYIYRFWNSKGLGWGREALLPDLDDTSMGFKLLRLHRYNVSADVFQNFCEDGKFFCYPGQTSRESVTVMLNLYRASQALFPNEDILENARSYTRDFLMEKLKKGELHDKWVIMKDFKGELEFALKNPWNSSLERLHVRKYIEQYGHDDVWIAKSFYRLPYVNNSSFLELAKAYFKFSQSMHIKEFDEICRWSIDNGLHNFTSDVAIFEAYATIVSAVHEPHLAFARVVWTQCYLLQKIILEYVAKNDISHLKKLVSLGKRCDFSYTNDTPEDVNKLFLCLYRVINTHATHALQTQNLDISIHLKNIWHNWLRFLLKQREVKLGTMEEYLQFVAKCSKLEPVVNSMLYFMGKRITTQEFYNEEYHRITTIFNIIIGLTNDIKDYKGKCDTFTSITIYCKENPNVTEDRASIAVAEIIDKKMQELAQCIYQSSTSLLHGKIYLHAAKVMNYLNQEELQEDTSIYKNLLSLIEPLNL